MRLFDFLFGSDNRGYNPEAWRSSDRSEHYGRSRSNWTSLEDWDCGSHDSDHDYNMSGFDSYNENNF